MKNLYNWGNNTVIVLKDKGNEALVKVINSKNYKTNALLNIPWNQLQKRSQGPSRGDSAPVSIVGTNNNCPTCHTPEMIPGIECPGCGFKEWIELNP